MKIKFLILFFAFCLLLCACSNAGGTDTTVADTTAADTTDSTENIQETEGEVTTTPTVPSGTTEGVPSLTVESETTENPFLTFPMGNDSPVVLPDDEIGFGDITETIPPTTVPPATQPGKDEAGTTVNDGPAILPDDEFDDDDFITTTDTGLVLPDDEFGE